MKKKYKGFTLIEVIISIAVLSFVSVIFLQLFFKSDQVQKNVKINDQHVFLSSNMLEILMAENDIEGFISTSKPSDKEINNEFESYVYYFNSNLTRINDKNQADYIVKVGFKLKQELKTGKLYDVKVQSVCYETDDQTEFLITSQFYDRKEN